MDKKRNVYKIINICLIIIPLIYIGYNSFTGLLEEPGFKEIVNDFNNINIFEIAPYLFLSCFFSIVSYLFSPFGIFTFGYIVYRIAVALAIRKNKKHPKFDIEYFRDYLNKISPAFVSYLMDYQIDLDRDVPAHLLKLQIDGYIEEKNGIFLVTKKDQTGLNHSDIILLDFVDSNFQNKSLLYSYKNVVSGEMVRQGYIKHTFDAKQFKNLALMFTIPQFFLFLIPFFGIFLTKINQSIIIFIILVFAITIPVLTFAAPIIIIVKIIIYFRWGRVKRTEKGNELLGQIYGLKNFLEDFTNIDDSSLNELHLREYYLVYAVVLGINDLANDTMLDKIKIQINQNV